MANYDEANPLVRILPCKGDRGVNTGATVVTSASDMTDTTKAYLYAGTTSGNYTKGHWYYWDGTEWKDGGDYTLAVLETEVDPESANAVESQAIAAALASLEAAIGVEIETLVNKSITYEGTYPAEGDWNDAEVNTIYFASAARIANYAHGATTEGRAYVFTVGVADSTRIQYWFDYTTTDWYVRMYLSGWDSTWTRIANTDKTLAVSGVGADSAVSGARINAARYRPSRYFLESFAQGYIDRTTGELKSSNKYVYCKCYGIDKNVPRFVLHITPDSTLKLQVLQLDVDDSVLSYTTVDGALSVKHISFDPGCFSVVLNIYKANGNDILPSEAPAVWINTQEIGGGTFPWNSLPDAEVKSSYVLKSFVGGEYVSSADGCISGSEEWYRTDPVRIKGEAKYTISGSMTTGQLLMFDKHFVYLGFITLKTYTPKLTPSNAYWGVINIKGTLTSATTHTLSEIEPVSRLQYPFNNCELFRHSFLKTDGTINTNQPEWDVLLAPVADKSLLYVNYRILRNFAVYDKDGNLLRATDADGDYEDVEPNGRVYELPANAALVALNAYSSTGSATMEQKQYACFYGADAEKIAAIGDSITFLDNRDGYPQSGNRYVGWQSYLRKQGYIVTSYGYSGYPYAHTAGTPETREGNGIADMIIDNEIDLSGFDKIILFGGANDVRLTVPYGDDNESYSSPNVDEDTFTGAIGKLVNYIRQTAPNAYIYIATTLPSESQSRQYAKNKGYRDKIRTCSEFWSLNCIDLFTEMDVSPTINFDEFFYDDVHPNETGALRLGKLFKKHIGG